MKRIVPRTALLIAVTFAGMFGPNRMAAQESGNVPATKAPTSPQAAPAVAKASPSAPTVAEQIAAHNKQMREDFPWLAKYRDADLNLAPPAPSEGRVVFMGDSVTEIWKFDGPGGYFPGKPYINRGIGGQSTPQMLLRFRQDVIDLKPKAVVILGGLADIGGATGTESMEQIEGNLASMAELAAVHHIRPVLCSVLPIFSISWSPAAEPAEKVVALNKWIRAYAAENGFVYVDFHTAMKDERDGLPPALSGDGAHPNRAGYALMVPLVEAGIEKALAQSAQATRNK